VKFGINVIHNCYQKCIRSRAKRPERPALVYLYDERPSHPQYIKGILKVPNSGWKIGVSYDAVGCASRRRTSPEPLVPEINRINQG